MKKRELNKLNNFNDPIIKEIYSNVGKKIDKNPEITYWTEEADKLRTSGDYKGIAKAACIYLSLAQKGLANNKYTETKLYHFAGHEFRRIEIFKRAAECYENAALDEYNKSINKGYEYDNKNLKFSLRSAGRSKSLYSDIGELEASDRSHTLQQNLKYTYYQFEKRTKIHLLLWRLFTNYGVSIRKWFGVFCRIMLTFIVIYQICFCCFPDSFNFTHDNNHMIITPIYFTFVTATTLGYGDISPVAWWAQFICLLNLFAGWILLGTGITFFTRK